MQNLSFTVTSGGVGVVTLDMPGRPFNVFSEEMIEELDQLAGRLESGRDDLTGVVFTSGKTAFMAGADLAMVEGFTTLRQRAAPDEIRRTFSRLGYLLRRIEQLPLTTVAAVNGLALGGGLELAMACHHRVLADTGIPCLGLPEILLGLLPGAGGTQRLPRLTTPAFAARMLMDGRPVTPAAALEAGLADQVVAPDALLDAARALATEAVAGARWDRRGWEPPPDDAGLLAADDALERLSALGWMSAELVHLYPAFGAIARCLIDGYPRSFDDAMEVEFDNFLELMLDPVAGNMVRTGFLAKTEAPKRARGRVGAAARAPTRITVSPAGEVPARLGSRFDIVDVGAGDVLFGLRRLPDAPTTDCLAEVRYVGEFEQVEAVEVATAAGEPGARTLAVLDRLRIVPVVVSREHASPAGAMLDAVRDWAASRGAGSNGSGAIATAVGAGDLFEAAGVAYTLTADFGAADRAAGLDLLAAVAGAATSSLAAGAVAGACDLDVLAVLGLGYPAWTGGPLSLLDAAGRGEIAELVDSPAVRGGPYYP